MPLYGCDRDGDASCEYNKGAQHCVMATAATWEKNSESIPFWSSNRYKP